MIVIRRPGNLAQVKTGENLMTQATNTEMPLICSIVNDADRINILPRYAGRHFIQLESLIYNVMGEYSKDYDGGFWIM